MKRMIWMITGLMVLLGGAGQANAGLVLTAAGVAEGFQLSTFVSTPGHAYGIAFASNGNVIVYDGNTGTRVLPSDTDGQNIATAGFGNASAFDLTQHGGLIYGNNGQILNNSGNVSGHWNGSGNLGISASPTTGHLFVSGGGVGGGIGEFDPVTGLVRSYGVSTDGTSVSPDGSVVFGGGFDGHLYGFNTSNGSAAYNINLGAFPDGTAAGTGALDGKVITNMAGLGEVWEVDLATGTHIVIANGGGYGDFAKVDPNNGSLLLTENDAIYRLQLHSGGGFSAVPEPATLTLLGIGGASLGGVNWLKRRRQPAAA